MMCLSDYQNRILEYQVYLSPKIYRIICVLVIIIILCNVLADYIPTRYGKLKGYFHHDILLFLSLAIIIIHSTMESDLKKHSFL